MVKNLPAMREIWVRSLGWEDPLEEGMITHSLQYFCLENPHGQRGLEGYIAGDHKDLDMTEQLSTDTDAKEQCIYVGFFTIYKNILHSFCNQSISYQHENR